VTRICLMSAWHNQEEFSSAFHKFSTHGNVKAGEENQSASKQRYITLWPTVHLCRTEMVTWQSSLHTRYNPSLHHFQTLVASFIWQIRSLSCCSVLSRLGNQSHLQCTTAQSWVMPSSFTAYRLPATAHSMSTLTQTEDVVWDTYVWDSLKESTRGKRGKGVHRKVTGETNCQATGSTFSMTQSTRGTVCLSDIQGCRIKLATSQSCLCHIRASCGICW